MSGTPPSPIAMRSSLRALWLSILLAAIVILAFLSISTSTRRAEEKLCAALAGRVSETMGERLNELLSLGDKLGSAVEARPSMDERSFSLIARSIMAADPSIVGVSLAPGAVIDRYYPAESGSVWKGHDLLSNPDRRDALVKAAELKTPIIAGPYESVDSQSVLFLRHPVYSNGKLWGFASLSADFGRLLESLPDPEAMPSVRFALAEAAEPAANAAPRFLGGEQAAAGGKAWAPLEAGGLSWRVYAMPASGWSASNPYLFVLLGTGLLASFLLFYSLRRMRADKPSAVQTAPAEKAPSKAQPKPEPILPAEPVRTGGKESERVLPWLPPPAQPAEPPHASAEPPSAPTEPSPAQSQIPFLRVQAEGESGLQKPADHGSTRTSPSIPPSLFPDLAMVEKKRGRPIAFKGPAVKGDLFMPEHAAEETHPLPTPSPAEQRAVESPQAAPVPKTEQRFPRQDFLFSLEETRAPRALSILVVDDSEANRDIVGRMLSLRGYGADFAESGQAALDACAEKEYALVLLDTFMPGMDGYKTAAGLRTAKPGSKTLIVGMSARGGQAELEKCKASGMDELLAKPFTLNQLMGIVERA